MVDGEHVIGIVLGLMGASASWMMGVKVYLAPIAGITLIVGAGEDSEIAQDELNHVRFLRAALTAAGATVQSRPAIDLTFFAGLATAAGISGTFNPFADERSAPARLA